VWLLVASQRIKKMLAKQVFVLLTLNCALPNVLSSHFRGGVITVRPAGTGVQGEVSYDYLVMLLVARFQLATEQATESQPVRNYRSAIQN